MILGAGRTGGALIAAGAACLFWLVFAATASDPLLGQPPIHPVLEAAGILAAALVFVLGGGAVLIALLPGGSQATGLQRTLVDGALAFIAAYLAFSYYGWDMRAALATSAIVSAVIGFAMQPTLGSLVSGVALNMDRQLRIGDGIIRGGEAIEVESLGWRNVLARKSDGRSIILPNARLADAELEFAPAGSPVRGETFMTLPTATSPDRVSGAVATLIGDLPGLDPSRPLSVTPGEFNPDSASIRYRIQYWVRHYRYLQRTEGQIQARLWYGFRRAGPPFAAGETRDPLAWAPEAPIPELVAACRPDLTPEAAKTLIEAGAVILFGSGEAIQPPSHLKTSAFLLLSGELVEAADFETFDPTYEESRSSVDALDRVSAERYVASELARHIGPYAEYAVREAARRTTDLQALCEAVAAEIPDEAARAQFLDEIRPTHPGSLKPGALLEEADATEGGFAPRRRLRARGEVTLLAIPADVIRSIGPLALQAAPQARIAAD